LHAKLLLAAAMGVMLGRREILLGTMPQKPKPEPEEGYSS